MSGETLEVFKDAILVGVFDVHVAALCLAVKGIHGYTLHPCSTACVVMGSSRQVELGIQLAAQDHGSEVHVLKYACDSDMKLAVIVMAIDQWIQSRGIDTNARSRRHMGQADS